MIPPPGNDQVVAEMITKMRIAMQDYATLDKITACYNVLMGVFNVCSVCGDKEDLLRLEQEMHTKLRRHIRSLWNKEN